MSSKTFIFAAAILIGELFPAAYGISQNETARTQYPALIEGNKRYG